jgi:Arc/MetJ family transcription regulator
MLLEDKMATNLAIDDNLLKSALIIGGLKTKKDTVNLALDEFIQRRKRQEVINLFGRIEFDKNYDYKKLREKR